MYMLERDYKSYNEVLYIQLQYNTLSILYRWIHCTDFAKILAVPSYNINVCIICTRYVFYIHRGMLNQSATLASSRLDVDWCEILGDRSQSISIIFHHSP